MEYYSFSTEYGAADELFKAVLSLDKARVEELRAAGVTLSEDIRQTLINGGGSMISNKPETRFWYLYLSDLENVGETDFVYISRIFFEETGAALYYSETVRDAMWGNFFSAEVFKCFLDCYDQTKMNKTRLMKGAIDSNSVECLAICAECGWLKMPRKRDEMIEYSQKNGRTECTAFLLEFKNKNFDLAEERVKAEKKMERALNASPNSVSELKKLWSFKELEGGGLVITSYKGKREEIIVPGKIGKDVVVEIGEGAFCPFARRVTPEMKEARRAVTKITLPGSVRWIRNGAFWACEALTSVNIPEGVEAIKENTFAECKSLERLVIPQSVKLISRRAFHACARITLIVERGSYAEEYCAKNNIAYRYKEDEQ